MKNLVQKMKGRWAGKLLLIEIEDGIMRVYIKDSQSEQWNVPPGEFMDALLMYERQPREYAGMNPAEFLVRMFSS